MSPDEGLSGGEKRENSTPDVPEDEIKISFVRSSGPGGQNVNKRDTKAVLVWSVGASAAFSDTQKEFIRTALNNRLNTDDEIVLTAQSERSQIRNREEVIQQLQKLVAAALSPRKERKATKPSRADKQRRLDEKRRQGQKKKDRRSSRGEW